MADNGIRGTENANGVPRLKPCPLCGGEAKLVTNLYLWACRCKACGAESGDYETAIEAIEAWNTRAERTCRNDDGWCSECEHFMHDGFKWCPWCGAKVVEE